MPGLNGTGPMGQGSKTGRGMGKCGDNNASGNGFGPGRGMGRRSGRGFRRGFNVVPETNENTRIDELEREIQDLKEQLKDK